MYLSLQYELFFLFYHVLYIPNVYFKFAVTIYNYFVIAQLVCDILL